LRKKNQRKSNEAEQRLLTADAFKQALLKYCSRHAKAGKDFALISVEIKRFELLAQKGRENQAHQFISSIRATCLSSLRDMDRLCSVRNDTFLLLLPEISVSDTKKVMQRIESAVKTTKVSLDDQEITAEVTCRFAHSEPHTADLQALLLEVDCDLDEHGELIHRKTVTLPFCTGSLEEWESRYEKKTLIDDCRQVAGVASGMVIRTFSAHDSWNGNERVTMKSISLSKALDAQMQESLVKKARVLQLTDHPAVTTTTDFFLDKGQELILVSNDRQLKSFDEKTKIDEAAVALFLMQTIQGLIYLLGLVPPVVPPGELIQYLGCTKEKHVVINNFEHHYMFPVVEHPDPESLIPSFAKLCQQLCARTNGALADEVQDLAQRLLSKSPPKELNTIYKVRTALKRIIDKNHVELANVV